MQYVIMFDENCEGDSAFCAASCPTDTGHQGDGRRRQGRQFLAAKGAGHQIYATKSELVLKTVDGVLDDAK